MKRQFYHFKFFKYPTYRNILNIVLTRCYNSLFRKVSLFKKFYLWIRIQQQFRKNTMYHYVLLLTETHKKNYFVPKYLIFQYKIEECFQSAKVLLWKWQNLMCDKKSMSSWTFRKYKNNIKKQQQNLYLSIDQRNLPIIASLLLQFTFQYWNHLKNKSIELYQVQNLLFGK